MARIRTIKPEFWSSPGVTEMNPWARLAFIAMWNWADDFGRGTYEPRELMGFIFPREDDMTVAEFRTHVGEIHRHVGVTFYVVDERPYFQIETWKKHQKTDPRLKRSKFPGPDEGTLIDPVSMQAIGQEGGSRQHVDVLHPHVDETHEHVGAGTGEQGNRGTGEHIPPPQGEDASDDARKEPKKSSHAYPEEFEDWYSLYPKKVGKRDALKAWKKAVKKIDPLVLNAKTDEYANHVQASGIEKQYMPHPATWLNREGWDDELIPPPQSPSGSSDVVLSPARQNMSAPDRKILGYHEAAQRVKAMRASRSTNVENRSG